ncbi:MAG: RIP metalloprotease RseP [Bacteroidota bacterium]
MTIINSILYFGITIGILVIIHELGHFLAAKFSGMKVDRFSLGFPPRAFGFRWASEKLQQKFYKEIVATITLTPAFQVIHQKLAEQKFSTSKELSLIFLSTVFGIEDDDKTEKSKTDDADMRPSAHLVMYDEKFPSNTSKEFKDELFNLLSNDQQLLDDFIEYVDISGKESFKQYYATDYCLSWLPIGGFVKVSGMIDESMDTEFLNRPPKPWEFRARPLWQRMLVISAGVIMNLILAVLIFWYLNFSQGRTVLQTTEISVRSNSNAIKSGFIKKDKILKINDREITNWNDLLEAQQIALANNEYNGKIRYDILRNGIAQSLYIQNSYINDTFGIYPHGILPKVGAVEPGKPADKIGLRSNDVIISVNNADVDFFILSESIRRNANTSINLGWLRNGERMNGTVTVLPEGRIGISLDTSNTVSVQHIQYSVFEALPAGIAYGVQITKLSYENIWHLISGNASIKNSLAGPVRIAQMSAQAAESGLNGFLAFVGLLSISLAILNIFPFPALDGGHLMFLIYEGIFRREVPAKVKLVVQQAGFYMLLLLMAFILFNDIANL